ncbi:hypothetical protein AB0E01_44335 [Nocardia vinacea]|uniref:hypothetical protein n=1 Tax=Nocardia vinacea TaxID=96468 RepID=UPI0033FDAEB6
MADDMVELLSRRTGPHLHDTLGDLADGVRTTRRFSNADEVGRRHVESSMREAERTGREPNEPDRVLAPPLEPGHAVNSYGLPETQRRYPVDDYITMWERKHGREMTPEERKVLGQGCVGVTKVRLGQNTGEMPPMNLAFTDPGSHRVIQNAESVLAPGEIANAAVKDWRKQLTQAENVVKEHGMNWSATDRYGTTRSAPDHLQHVKDNLEKARAEAKEVWSNLAKGDIRQMLDARCSS